MAVADVPPPRTALKAHFADRIRREVVIQVIGLKPLALQVVGHALVELSAQRCHAKRLRLTAGKQRRAVRPRQHSALASDIAHRVKRTAVNALLLLEDHGAHIGFEQSLQLGLDEFLRVWEALGQARQNIGIDRVDAFLPLFFERASVGLGDPLLRQFGHGLDQFGIGFLDLDGNLLLADFGDELLLQLD